MVMLRAIAETTREAKVKTLVSLDPLMVDGTGMCGGCRVIVGGQTLFACVDGPIFDAHLHLGLDIDGMVGNYDHLEATTSAADFEESTNRRL